MGRATGAAADAGPVRRCGSRSSAASALVAVRDHLLPPLVPQVLSGDKYLAEAKNNQVREFTVQAPRGEILDRHGKVLVDNRTALALQVNADRPADEPRARRARLFERVGEVAGLRPEQIRNKIRARGEGVRRPAR